MAGPTAVTLTANEWVKVADNVTTSKIYNKVPRSVVLQTYRAHEGDVPKVGNDQNYRARTISFDADTKTITDTAEGFTFEAGDFFMVLGSEKNDGFYSVDSAAAGAIVVNESLQDEDAGADVKLFYILEGVPAFKNGQPEYVNAIAAVEVYMISVGKAGSVRVDTHMKRI